MGVAIVADIFMQAIERVTSTQKKMWVDVEGEKKLFHVRVWNDTVANLSLMALGSSAPEILLNVLGVVGNDMFSEELGPSTIVGSAAFNLLVISAVCVMAIKSPDIRKVNDTHVYACTAFFSIFAYLWLVIILMGPSPDIITVPEALITFAFFPLLVALAYAFDVGLFARCMKAMTAKNTDNNKIVSLDEDAVFDPSVDKMAQRQMMDLAIEEHMANAKGQVDAVLLKRVAQKIQKESSCTPAQAVKLADIKLSEEKAKTKAFYRIQGTRTMLGGTMKKIGNPTDEPTEGATVQVVPKPNDPANPVKPSAVPGGPTPRVMMRSDITVGFASPIHGVLESEKVVKAEVVRSGRTQEPVSVCYETFDGSALAGQHYKAATGTLMFQPNQLTTTITVELIDDDSWTKDTHFKLRLSQALCKGTPVSIDTNEMEVVIIDDDDPGVLAFMNEKTTVKENAPFVTITVMRRRGRAGRITCQYMTKDGSAIAPTDYIATSGELVFETGEASKTFDVAIVDDDVYEKDESFLVVINDIQGGAVFDARTDGSSESCICEVTIVSDEETKKLADKVLLTLNVDRHKLMIGSASWAEQFADALRVSEEGEKRSAMVYVTHCISCPWKLLFAFIPPTAIAGGWLAFWVSLALIGVVTAFISDLAGLLGCTLGIKDSITAITFVAMGTSLPDTFASKQAAEQDPYADASIGNVTGSNSVNVFLGLGLPWLIGAIYWSSKGATAEWKEEVLNTHIRSYASRAEAMTEYRKFINDNPDGGFYVRAGDLGFSVVVFCGCALSALLLLALRRKLFGGELGGPFGPKVASAVALVVLWGVYLTFSVLKVEKTI